MDFEKTKRDLNHVKTVAEVLSIFVFGFVAVAYAMSFVFGFLFGKKKEEQPPKRVREKYV